MDFFNSLTLDLKMLVVAIAGFVLLALFSGNQKAEKRYLLVLAILAAVGVYCFNHVTRAAEAQRSVDAAQQAVTAPAKHKPLVSTTAR